MSCGNPFNHLFHNVKESILNLPKHDHQFRNDKEMECLLYGFRTKPESTQRLRRVIL